MKALTPTIMPLISRLCHSRPTSPGRTPAAPALPFALPDFVAPPPPRTCPPLRNSCLLRHSHPASPTFVFPPLCFAIALRIAPALHHARVLRRFAPCLAPTLLCHALPRRLCSHSIAPPRASSTASCFPSTLRFPSTSPHLCLASLHFTSLNFTLLGLPAKPSQAPNVMKTGYRTSRVWIWSSENGRQGGIGQPSQEGYQHDEEMNSIEEE
ncbi:hypothetical protein B0H13DRAFT_2340306 [Mycena leptocephala]|nr:hypothetical protein B0H13DRAFT_2340306 [Mycena leptocephala]